MHNYQIRRAVPAELDRIIEIYSQARDFMVHSGNPTQWADGYPKREMLEKDMDNRRLYVAEDASGIHGVFFFDVMDDPTYTWIEDGVWGSNEPYGVIHRIASDGAGGIFAACLLYCTGIIRHIRIDTHQDNRPMQHVLEKNGFHRRGIIYVTDGSPRIAYDRI